MCAAISTSDPALVPAPAARRAPRIPPWLPGPALAVGIAALLVASVAIAGGGLQLRTLTVVEIIVDLLAGATCAAAVLVAPSARRLHLSTRIAIAAFAGLEVLTGLSLIWSIDPSGAWIEANRTFSLLAAFGAGIALARLAPHRWRALLGAILLASASLSLYALLTKVFPAWLAPDETYARLQQPFEYWNAVGLLAALGVPPALWLGSRRDGHGVVNALAFPLLALFLITILVAYSRGALLAVLVGVALWLWLVPLRLRSAAVLAPPVIAGLLVSFWTFTQDGLDKDGAPLWLRRNAGDEFGVALIATGVVMLAAGLYIVFSREDRRLSPAARRGWGTALLVTLALVPVAVAGALAASSRGFGGSISHGWHSLTDPNANTPANDPSRLTAVGSVRARYWREAIDIFKARPAVGVGAGGYAIARSRFRRDTLDVHHAHGYLVQTAADLGIAGQLLSLVLFGAWVASALRAAAIWRPWPPGLGDAERQGLVTLAILVAVFGVHSLIDWTWFIPGTALPALLCAGWLSGRAAGPPRAPGATLRRELPWRAAAAAVVFAAALAGAFATLGPERAAIRVDDALAALAAGQPDRARTLANEAVQANPLAVEPLFTLSRIEATQGRIPQASAPLEHAVQLQPANPTTWLHLAGFELATLHDRSAAKRDVRPALYLDPRSTYAQALYIAAATKPAKP